MSLISAISQDRVVANQLIEGGVDGIVFENFIYHTLLSVRNDKELQ
jgi:predicted TIM-barrel enzyme